MTPARRREASIRFTRSAKGSARRVDMKGIVGERQSAYHTAWG